MVAIGARVRVSVPMSGGGRVDVVAYALRGADGLVIHRAPNAGDRGAWRVTHADSGMRLPGNFRTRQGACDAVAYLLAAVPDALAIMGRIVSRSQRAGESARVTDAWRVALGIDPAPVVDPFAGIRAEIRERFGDWDAASRAVLADIGADGWTYAGDVLTCPHGHQIEDDGACPSGCVSPFVAAGLI